MHDLHSNVLIVNSAKPQTLSGTTPITSGDIDRQGYEAVEVIANFGNLVDTLNGTTIKVDLMLQHADDDGTGNPGSYAACADTDVLGFTGLASGVFKTLNVSMDQKLYPIGYRGGKRFIKLTATPAGLSTGGPFAITTVLGKPSNAPTSNQT
jgi:hypothetical protein